MGVTEKYGTAIIAILIGGGFAFGGIASYSGLVGGGGGNNADQQERPELPAQNFTEGTLDLTTNEKAFLAAQNDVVFATGYYNTSEDKEQLQTARNVQSEFGDKMYLNYVNSSQIPPQTELRQTPAVHFVGAVVQNQRARPSQNVVYNMTESEIASGTCNLIRDLPESAVVYCFS
jgi:hypothetical protein